MYTLFCYCMFDPNANEVRELWQMTPCPQGNLLRGKQIFLDLLYHSKRCRKGLKPALFSLAGCVGGSCIFWLLHWLYCELCRMEVIREDQEVSGMQLAGGKSAPSLLRLCLQRLHPAECFCSEQKLFARSQPCSFPVLFRFELRHLCGLDGLHARGGGLLAGDDVSCQRMD